jgi:hypothetical protein
MSDLNKDGFLAPDHLTRDQLAVRVRLGRILFRHTLAEDINLSDHDLVTKTMERHLKGREQALVDPAE